MKRPRVYQDSFAPSSAPFSLEEEASHHLGRVIRLGAGESFVISDGRGQDYLAEVTFSGDRRRSMEARVLHPLEPQPDPRVSFILAVALSKGERFERVIEKAAELGATAFVPMLTARSLGVERGQRLDRWQRMARESSALAGRSRWMEMHEPRTFKSILSENRGIVFVEGRPGISLKTPPGGEPLWLLIGPEGGFTDEEVEQAERAQWKAAGLGPRNLRVETAAMVAMTAALLENGEFTPAPSSHSGAGATSH